ncbi:hypothetical protein NP233_g758 [Leucocoprinus birnbaumii]|uniref:Uncharacterized protein n=1 Tax=Leucocoprinus birnbaumii TaxID=56174 RepID=A0AAD5W1R1_9AGAR|nr:hypothetical protein NP233_g758 [Leucocoprinus birnbaumii]
MPLYIPFNPTDSQIKSGFTVLFIVWNTLAVVTVEQILADAFSREWSVHSSSIIPGTTDRVSVITSGILDRIGHFFSKRASGTFRTAFLASLCCIALTKVAPSTMTTTSSAKHSITLRVGSLISRTASNMSAESLLAIQRHANLIVRMELLEETPYHFEMPANHLVIIPIDTIYGTAEYNTDIVGFNHNCRWEAPTIVNATAGDSNVLVVHAAGQALSVEKNRLTGGSSISPLSVSNISTTQADVGCSAYLFIGGDSTLFNNSTVALASRPAIDLGTLPVTALPPGIIAAGPHIPFEGLYASVLICDPQTRVSGGRVWWDDGVIEIVASGETPIGDFPLDAANIIFSNALQMALVDIDSSELSNLINSVASSMFMDNSSSIDWSTARGIAPIDIPTINSRVDEFMSSAAKAFLDGYRGEGTGPSTRPTFETTTVTATAGGVLG